MSEGNGLIDTRIQRYDDLMSPEDVRKFIPRPEIARQTVLQARLGLEGIIDHKDDRIVVIAGECSMHDQNATLELATYLNELARQVSSKILVINRKHGEKPRTAPSWEGFLVDPHMDGSEDIVQGIYLTREILINTLNLGLPCSTEYLDNIVPQYTADLISWAAIGARTANSPQHRKLASGLSMPIGIKNDVHGDVGVAINAVLYARKSHSLLGINETGRVAVPRTKGNPYTHIVLRGGENGTNYDTESVREAQTLLEEKGLAPNVMIDCSHGNSAKDYTRQPAVFEEVVKQIRDGSRGIIGIMLECNLFEGSQKIPPDLSGFDRTNLRYGVSVTDGGISIETARKIILEGYKILTRSSVSISGSR